MSTRPSWRGLHLYTVGHSTRTLDDFVELLRAFDVHEIVDIRTIPKSRHNPQFGADALRSQLRSRRIRYVHLAELGGLRRARKDSINAAWRNASFRGYADYMSTDEFEAGLSKLHALASQRTVALMCAEAVPWRCHRSLVGDALTARGARVDDIMSVEHASAHRMTPFAAVKGTRVTYPGQDATGLPLATRAPFHLEATVRVLQRRSTNLVDVWVGDRYLRALRTADGLALVQVMNHGTIADPNVRFTVLSGSVSDDARTALDKTLRRVLGMDVDPKPLQRLAEREPGLASTARALRGMRPPRFSGLFEAFVNVVPFQQVSLDAGVSIVGRLVARFGETMEHEGRRFYAALDAPVLADASPDAIRACGLSLRKAETLREVARAIASGELSEKKLARMSSADAIGFLRELKGIGPWSAALLLLRGLGRLDVFPPDDVGAARGLSALTGRPAGPALERVIERFGERRGYLYFCSLGASLLAKGLIHAAPLRPRARALDAEGKPSAPR